MVKLILSDVDGTLLERDEEELKIKILNTVELLEQKNILFAAASGRGYYDLRRLFDKVKDKMAFVCNDGAMTIYKDKVLDINPMDKTMAQQLIGDITYTNGCEFLLYGRL